MVSVAAANGAAAVVILGAAYGVAGGGDQRGWLVMAVSGVLVAGLLNSLHLYRFRRRVARHELWPSLDGVVTHRPSVAEIHVERRNKAVAAAAGMTRYHRPDCLLVAGKATTGASPEALASAGLQPCGMCQP